MKEKSLPRLLFELALLCLQIAIPLFFAFVVPPRIAPAYLLLALAGEWIEYRIRHKVSVLDMWVLGGNVALTRCAVLLIHGRPPGEKILQVLTGTAVFILLLLLHEWWKKACGIRNPERKPKPAPASPAETASIPRRREPVPDPEITGPSAWGAEFPVTPEGETLRVLYESEIAMGGPVTGDYLFPDGSLLTGCGSSTGFTPDGRYFVAPLPSRGEWSLLLFDRQEHVLHVYRDEDRNIPWEIDQVDNESVTGRISPIVNNANITLRIDDILAYAAAHATADPLVNVVDLKLARKHLEHLERYPGTWTLPDAPAGAPLVSLHPWMPASLRALKNPLAPLSSPKKELIVNGQPSGMLVWPHQLTSWFVWRTDGLAFACEASTAEEGVEAAYRVWSEAEGWRELSKRSPLHSTRTSVKREKMAALYAEALILAGKLERLSLSSGSFGRLSSWWPDSSRSGGVKPFPPTAIDEKISLTGASVRYESEPLRHGRRLTWEFLRKDREEWGGYAIFLCSLVGQGVGQGGAQALDGEWLLDHAISLDTISRDRRHVAMIAYAPAPAVPHRVAVLDSETGALTWLAESFPDPHFAGFSRSAIHILSLAGRSSEKKRDIYDSAKQPPERYDELPPPPDQAYAFLQSRPDSDLYYRLTEVKPD
ncbi:hypothetical protein [Silvibacterium dinghuense]|uniref:Uncharacterized protein n=1 Tax=Silvibacterium dinghuense TaxID=1560006 RepID=A0A4Q1S8M3_9BACT|nr:hypothetical protein [Silvibacterium dinghuense]RXS93239.1 hypothetical protein ESZ00_17890 [Silvibacterium dinghuense]GGH04163.1 hypothetical protein GCM10011586_20200 [Silvibacterium dinghuense]